MSADQRIVPVGASVNDVDGAVAFYVDALGLGVQDIASADCRWARSRELGE